MISPSATTPQPSASEPTMPSRRQVHPARFGLIFGIVATVLTLGAIALAAFAPQLTSVPPLQVPQGWQQVYNDNPSNSASSWDSGNGCSFPTQGLDIASDSTCQFKHTGQPGLTDSGLADGVLVVAKLAPAADVSLSQDAGILLDNAIIVIISQQGDYQICHTQCDILSRNGEVLASGSTTAWHSDAFVANEVAVLYEPDKNSVSFYVNGQFVKQVDAGLSPGPTVALMTSSSGEAIFTHVAIYAGSVS